MLTEKDYCDYKLRLGLRDIGYSMSTCQMNDGPIQMPKITLYEAQKWLREEKGIFVHVDVPWKTDYGLGWSYFCCNRPMSEEDKEVCFASGEFYNSYEEALSEGIKVAVEILKEIINKRSLEIENTEYNYGHNVNYNERDTY